MSGWIMFDQIHSDHLQGGSPQKPRRGKLLEVHTITKLEVQENGTWRDLDHYGRRLPEPSVHSRVTRRGG
jgi:hypothetical protein